MTVSETHQRPATLASTPPRSPTSRATASGGAPAGTRRTPAPPPSPSGDAGARVRAGLRVQDPAQRAWLEPDAPARELQTPRHVDVFGEPVRPPVTHLRERAPPEPADHARHREESAHHHLRALDEPDQVENSPIWSRPSAVDRVRMRGLPVTPPTSCLRRESPYHPRERVLVQERVAVDADHVLRVRQQNSPARSAAAFPQFSGKTHDPQRGIVRGERLQISPVASVLPSSIAIIS